MIGAPNTGKSAAAKEVSYALSSVMKYGLEYSIDSGPALVEALGERNRLLLMPDEFADQFEKAKTNGGVSKNSLFGEWLRLYEQNTTANRTKRDPRSGKGGQTQVTDGHFAMLGSVTTERNATMWQGSGGARSGLRSRFCLAYSENVCPKLKTPNDEQEMLAAVKEIDALCSGLFSTDDFYDPSSKVLFLNQEAQEILSSWRNGEPEDEMLQRGVDMAKRFALLNAFCAGKPNVDAEAMKLGLDFADYRLAVMRKLFEPDAASYVQAFENRITAFFAVNPQATMYQLLQGIRPEKYLGGYEPFNRAFAVLVKVGRLTVVGQTRKKQPVYAWQAGDEKAA